MNHCMGFPPGKDCLNDIMGDGLCENCWELSRRASDETWCFAHYKDELFSLIGYFENLVGPFEATTIKDITLKVLEYEAEHWVENDTPEYESGFGNRQAA
jgi:hypothetical protein